MTRLTVSLWALYFVCSALVVASVQGQTCGIIGNNVEQSFDRDSELRFFLNTQDPAQCNGTVNGFQYCYYRHFSTAVSYAFTFAVYRETSPGSYSAVSEAFTAERDSNPAAVFACLTFPLSNQIQIQSGDMIGACIYNPPDLNDSSRRETYVVGDEASNDSYLMRTSNSGCGDFTVPITVSSLSRRDRHVLHISANITAFPTTGSPTNPMIGTTTSVMSTITTNNPSLVASGTSSTEVAVAIVLVTVFILVIASVAILVVIIVFVTKKKRYAGIGGRSTVMHLNTHGPHSSEGSESINTTDVTITAAENVQCQSIDLKINDAYGAKADLKSNEAYGIVDGDQHSPTETAHSATEGALYHYVKTPSQSETNREIEMSSNEAYGDSKTTDDRDGSKKQDDYDYSYVLNL